MHIYFDAEMNVSLKQFFLVPISVYVLVEKVESSPNLFFMASDQVQGPTLGHLRTVKKDQTKTNGFIS